MTALAQQLAAEEEARKKERERYAQQMGVAPAEVGTGNILINRIGGTKPYVNLIGGPNMTAPQPAPVQKPGGLEKYGALATMLFGLGRFF